MLRKFCTGAIFALTVAVVSSSMSQPANARGGLFCDLMANLVGADTWVYAGVCGPYTN